MIVKVLNRTPLSILVWNAMCAETVKGEDMADHFKIPPEHICGDASQVELTFLVNGVPVNLDTAFEKAVDSFLADLDQHVLHKATELVDGSDKLRELASEIENADWKIRSTLEALMKENTK